MRGNDGRLTFALLVDWFTGWGDIDCYQWRIYSGVADYAKENNINLMTFVTGRLNSPREWENNRNILFEFIQKNRIDGVIAIPPCINMYGVDNGRSPILEKYLGIPVVVIGEDIAGHSSVYVNNYDGMKEVIEHLINVHHCRRIAYMKGVEGSKEVEWRYQAYLDVLEKYNIAYDPELVYLGDCTFASGCKGTAHFINSHVEFDGLVGSNDEMAVGAIIEYYRIKGKPLEGIPIASFDDTETSKIHNLTTVHQSFFDEGRTAANVLNRLIQGEPGPIKEELSANMIIRSSCGCIPTDDNKHDHKSIPMSNSFYDMILQTRGGDNYLNEYQTMDVETLEEELLSTIDINGQMDLLYYTLPKLGIDRAFAAIYENPERPLDGAKLLLAYTEEGRYEPGKEGVNYSTALMLPDDIWNDLQKKRFNIIVQALHHDSQLGFVMLNFNFKPNQILERIRSRLSSSIKAALMVKSIKNHAAELEWQVIERTKELSVTNEQLLEEVNKRRDAEQNLKSALAELESYNKILHLQSIRDELTGLYNRRGFLTLGNEQIERLKTLEQGCLIFYADLDGLKQINDKYGHAEGDYAIIKTAEILTHAFRSTDIIARLGGDEFTVLVIGALPRDKEFMWGRIKDLCKDYNETSNKPYRISVSIGCTYFKSSSAFNLEQLLKEADVDLYNEKQRRKQYQNTRFIT